MHGTGNLLRFERLVIFPKTYTTVALIVELDTSEHLLKAMPPMTLSHRHTVNPGHREVTGKLYGRIFRIPLTFDLIVRILPTTVGTCSDR